jgi:hypothetical protein
LRRAFLRVFYRVPRRALRTALTVYEQAAVEFCCAEMGRQWDRLIGFGVKGYPRSTSRDVNLFTVRPQAHGSFVLEVTAVVFCPWCGVAVEMIRRERGAAPKVALTAARNSCDP